MFIQNIDQLKVWLTDTLKPICNADPATLAKYVVALIKKDLPENELVALCIDQLDVFLHDKCKSFVEKLFLTLSSQSYANGPSVSSTPITTPIVENPVVHITTAISQLPYPSQHPQSNLTANTSEQIRHDFQSGAVSALGSGHRRHSRSPSPKSSKRNSGSERFPDERRHRHDDRRKYPRHDDRRRRSRSRGRSPRNRSLHSTKDKSRFSPSLGRRSRSLTKSRSKSPVNHSKKDRSRTQVAPQSHGSPALVPDKDGVFISSDSLTNGTTTASISVVTNTAVDKSRFPNSLEMNVSHMRCRDYDEKGYCMRGDMCPFDHGLDPLIVDEVDMPSDMPFPSNTTGAIRSNTPHIPHGPPGVVPCPPPNIRYSGPRMPIDLYQPEGYNPENPSISRPHINLPPPPPGFWTGPLPPPGRPPIMPPRGPPLMARFSARIPPPRRDLVTLTQPPPTEAPVKSLNNRVVLPPRHAIDQSAQEMSATQSTGTPQQATQSQKRPFDFSRLGGQKRPGYNPSNMSLEVRKIPKEFNTILKLNEHFSKFGTLVNVQVSYDGDPEAAVVTYARHCDALSAYRSSDPLFHNRFIKVFWFSPKDGDEKEKAEVMKTAAKPRTTIPPSHKLQLNKKVETADKPMVSGQEGTITRTVYNKTSSKLTTEVVNAQGTDGSKASEITPAFKDPKSAQKKDLQLQKQKRELLKKYIEQEKLLIEKLEAKKNPEEKASVMKTIKHLDDNIKKLQLELSAKAPSRSLSDKKKELLDTELDLINKENSGLDATDLRCKLKLLQKQASSMGLLSKSRGRDRGRRGRGRGRGRLNYSRGNHRLVLDRRSTQMKVSGFTASAKDSVVGHLKKHGVVEATDCGGDDSSVLVTFKSRKDAEKASIKGIRFGNEVLQMNWHEPDGVGTSQTDLEDDQGGPLELDEDALLAADDEDEDEDKESRSWRR